MSNITEYDEPIEGVSENEAKQYIEDNTPITPEEAMDFAQGLRKQLVNSIVSERIPSDNEDRSLVLQALRDMTTTAIGMRRVDIESKGVDNDKKVIEIVERLAKQRPHGSRLPEDVESHYAPIVDANALRKMDLLQDETVEGSQILTSKDFEVQFEEDNPL